MTGEDEKRQRVIVAAVDDSEASEWAVRWAADEAMMHTSLLLSHVIDPMTLSTPDRGITQSVLRSGKRRGRQALTRALHIVADQIDVSPMVAVRTEIAYGAVVPTLSTLTTHTWMIAVGSRHWHSWGGHRLGSVSARSSRHATSSVAVVHGELTTEQPHAPVIVTRTPR